MHPRWTPQACLLPQPRRFTVFLTVPHPLILSLSCGLTIITRLSICLAVRQPINFVCLFVWPLACLFVYLSPSLSVYLYVGPSVCPPARLFVCAAPPRRFSHAHLRTVQSANRRGPRAPWRASGRPAAKRCTRSANRIRRTFDFRSNAINLLL